jgi:hypothetical protein
MKEGEHKKDGERGDKKRKEETEKCRAKGKLRKKKGGDRKICGILRTS